ncbi:MAG TPA: SpoIID/LytB domain-containing protein [Chiayiivirga sp.]|nr:SpoIID/LytB domain-containing protein [Chiayiivirga sp.]
MEPLPFARAAQRWRQHPDAVLLQGYVRRVSDGEAIVGAELRIDGHTARSGADGYFELDLPAAAHAAQARVALDVSAAGYARHRRDGLVLVAGVQRLLVALGPGVGVRSVQTIGALDRGDRAVDEDALATAAPPRTVTPAGLLLAPTMLPPATIRVGFADAACTQSCCTNACSNTCTLSLETYVKRGLDSEWIASWNAQSLRAGSVAYRGYGAWRVANPIRSNFDICSSACCQVNDAGTSSSTDAAAARTPGILLTRNGSDAASAEYSAENNSWDDPNDGLSCSNEDLSCGNGFAGSPSAGWPCLSDAVSINKGCFGHGRGMSQWGTQRWALQPKAWPWMVDHYFNDNGTGSGLRTAVMSSPLLLADLAAQPAVLAPGSSFQILANASNSAGATHSRLLIGASLYRAGVGYLDDSAHDAALALAPGTTAITRTFDVPPSSIDGSYDLLLSLYLDVDENGSISAADLALALARINGAVTIQTPPVFDGFSEGFEDVPRPVP